jgi:hypothetical protein
MGQTLIHPGRQLAPSQVRSSPARRAADRQLRSAAGEQLQSKRWVGNRALLLTEDNNASWRIGRRMGSPRFHRCERNAFYNRRCDCIPVPCSSEDMDFGSDRDRGGNDGDRCLWGSIALTDHLTEVMRPPLSVLGPLGMACSHLSGSPVSCFADQCTAANPATGRFEDPR